jgi:plasmid replication initiation protein
MIIKSNNYVLSKYSLSSNEQKLILLCISKINQREVTKETELVFELSASEIQQFLGFNSHRIYEELHRMALNLAASVVDIEKDGKFEVYSPFPDTSYSNGIFQMSFNKKLNPELIDLKANFTQYALQNVKQLKNYYSLRLYEILKSFQWRGEPIELELTNLKELLGICILDKHHNIIEEKYKNYGDVKKKVLLQAQKEIKENTDIEFEFKEVKKGKKVTAVTFYINSSETLNELAPLDKSVEKISFEDTEVIDQYDNIQNKDQLLFENIDLCRIFLPNELSTSYIQRLLLVADNDINLIKEKYELSKKQKNISNLGGWLISAIVDDYQSLTAMSKEISGNNKFHNFPQRDYSQNDYENLEQSLMRKIANQKS